MNFQSVAVVYVLGHRSVRYTLKRMMQTIRSESLQGNQVFSLKVVDLLPLSALLAWYVRSISVVTVFQSDLVACR